jgi:hypothetical protein
MDPRIKNRIGAGGFALLALAGVAWFAAVHWPETWTFSTPKGTPVVKAIDADLTGYDNEKMVAFIKDLQFKGSTHDQRLALANKLKKYFDTMPVLQRLALMLRMRKVFEEDPNSELVKNSSAIMQDFWNQQIRDYMGATPEERAKMLDARIDEQVAMEKMEKLQDAAKSLLGMKPDASKPSEPVMDPMMRDIGKFRGFLSNAIRDSFANTPPTERAGATQFFMDMQERRRARGLPVAF